MRSLIRILMGLRCLYHAGRTWVFRPFDRRPFDRRPAQRRPTQRSPAPGRATVPPDAAATLVNDVHSQLNPTAVSRIEAPSSLAEFQQIIAAANRDEATICFSGARHAMGGQQFLTDEILVDSRRLNRVLDFDVTRGLLRCEAGIDWPQIVAFLLAEQKITRPKIARPSIAQRRSSPQKFSLQKTTDQKTTDQKAPAPFWGIAQKQTGADRLCLGGALSANVHGRGLKMRPLIADVESFTLVDAQGQVRHCSRDQNPELFRLAIGGYGLFGAIYAVTLRLTPRRKLQRIVDIISSDELMAAFEGRIRDGYLYGDFQFMTDESQDDFLRRGVFSCYRPVDDSTLMPRETGPVASRAWKELIYLAHTDKARAYQLYADYYRSTSGQLFWSDTHQMAAYLDDYHHDVDRRMGAPHASSEIITEIFVPRAHLHRFLEEARADFRRHNVNLIYGTVRLIERDDESVLAWAKASYACVIFNLHTEHTPEGRDHSARAFRRLIDMAIQRGGSYYLTYHRHATKAQVEACYPGFAQFLQRKKEFDADERFQSDWYRHYRQLFAAP